MTLNQVGGRRQSDPEQAASVRGSSSSRQSATPPPRARYLAQGSGTRPFPAVVAMGASGGVDAVQRILAHLPADPGMAFVIVQHLDPGRPSTLARVLQAGTGLGVVEAANGTRVEPNRVYVIPCGADLRIESGTLRVVPRRRTRGLQLPIDTFFRSLAEYEGPAVGVVLSGSGADGTEGLWAIKAKGGIVMAQEPQSAEFRGMPESAIAAGVVDFRATPEGLAEELGRLSGHPYIVGPASGENGLPPWNFREETTLTEILELVRSLSSVDFSGYRRTTVLRRIDRRMAVRRVRSLEEYASALRDDAGEARALVQEMLLHVTSFFRDPQAFLALKEEVFPTLLARGEGARSVRIWVPGCSTGEEAYGIVVCVLELMDQFGRDVSIKVFATDLSEQAITTARLGVYPAAALGEVSPERLSRFFERSGGKYRISSEVRDQCVFVKHDLHRDPPFAKLDLISCRNVFIDSGAELHQRVIPLFYDCLNPQGYLFTGRSEPVLGFRDRFTAVDKGGRVFMKTGTSPQSSRPAVVVAQPLATVTEIPGINRIRPERHAQRQADFLMLSRYSPPGVIVDDRLEIIEFRGRTGAYLEPSPGQPNDNLLVMAHETLVPHLREALERAKAQSMAVRQEALQYETGSELRVVDLEVVPLPALPDSTERYFLVVFEERDGGPRKAWASSRPPAPDPTADRPTEPGHRDAALAVKEYLCSLISEHQATIEDLTVEKEELTATNQHLQHSYDELQARNRELTELANVLDAAETPVIVLDLELRVRRFTAAACQIGGFIAGDIGRSIEDLRLKIRMDDLVGRLRRVIESSSPLEYEIETEDGRWYSLHARPYPVSGDCIDGVVLSFLDVDRLKCAVRNAEQDCAYARGIIDSVRTALVVLGGGLRVASVNEAFCELFGVTASSVQSKGLPELEGDLWQQPALLRPLEEALANRKPFTGLEVTTEVARLGRKVFHLGGRPLPATKGPPLVLLTIDDVTALRSLETEKNKLLEAEKRARFAAERANHAKDVFLATLSHELRTPLSTILMSAEILKRVANTDPTVERASTAIERSATMQVKLVDDLLDVARIASGRLVLDQCSVDLTATIKEAVACARPVAEAKALELSVELEDGLAPVYGDATRLQQVATNLLNNAIKFTPSGGRVSVRLRQAESRAEITVTDTGEGIRPEALPRLFQRFVQGDTSVTRARGGLGLGLSIVRHLVELHGGEVRAESRGEGQGATFRVLLPLGVRAGSDASAKAVGRGIGGVRVLLVEDDEDSREAYATMLTQLGAEVLTAPSAERGLAAMQDFRPQVILADIVMPGEDGLSFIQRVRHLAPEKGGQTPAAALSAMASQEDRQRSMQLGYQMHVAKPVDSARLAALVNVLVESKRVARG